MMNTKPLDAPPSGDDRIPLRVVAREAVAQPLPAGAAVVAPDGVAVGGGAAVERVGAVPRLHAIGCACCSPRAALARALARLFVRRARGEVGFFREVLVALPRREVEDAFGDVLVSARFRIDP
jgi:hypothetical protein